MKFARIPFLLLLAVPIAPASELRVGIIGCDTSHVIAFTETWNNPEAKGHVPGCKVVAAFRGGSADIPESQKHLAEFAPKLSEKYGVKFYDSIEELCTNVDAVCLESLDGRPKLEQLKPILKARKPVFVDKPMAGSLRDVIEMFRLAEEARTPIFSSSSLRYAKNSQAVRAGSLGKIRRAVTYGPCDTEPHHPDLYWYGVHGVEALFTVMGTGCESVVCMAATNGTVEVAAAWRDGRSGVFRSDKGFHGQAWGEKGEADIGAWDGYVPLVIEITKFFQTGVAPMKPEETLEIFAFMEAADESKKSGGTPVKIQEMLARARELKK